MRQVKKGLVLLILSVFLLALLSGAATANEAPQAAAEDSQTVSYTDSGRTSVPKPTMEELKSRLNSIPGVGSFYASEPTVTGPDYRPAVLSAEGYANTLAWINYYRAAAGLEAVTFTDELNLSASYGALVDAAINQLTHTPTQPSDMPDDIFKKGDFATRRSNISYSSGYGIGSVLRVAVQGQMADESAGNIPVLGHRRWLLNPGVQTMGVGSANNGSRYYTAIRVFGDDVTTQTVTDYTFIAWPASGNNLSDTFAKSVPWSITLNPARYATPKLSQVKVVLKRESDGKTWTFDSNTSTATIGASYDYFNVDDVGYGVSNCIIFRPAYAEFSQYEGWYTVDVTGLSDRSGNAAELHYQVCFSSSSAVHEHEYVLDSWVWASDYSSAEAVFVCKTDTSHKLRLTAEVNKVTTPATCTTKDKTVYTASVTYGGKTYTDKKTVEGKPLGHNWGTGSITWNGFESATASRKCQRDSSHVETVQCKIITKVLQEPTFTEEGLMSYTATGTFSDNTEVTETITRVLPVLSWTWTRLAGDNRLDTMQKVLQESWEDGSCKSLVVSTAMDFPDALAGASLAGLYECPIVLTLDSKLLAYTKDEIQRLASEEGCTVYILGGTAAVSDTVKEAIAQIPNVTDVQRVAGSNREQTALEVYREGAESWGETVILATAMDYADTLAISPYAYAAKTPILLARGNGKVGPDVQAVFDSKVFSKVIIVGGKGVISEETENYLRDELELNVVRLAGANRFETGAEIIKWELGQNKDAEVQPEVEMTLDGMGVATGMDFSDSLGSVSLLGKNHSVLLLTMNIKSGVSPLIKGIVDDIIVPNASQMTKGYIFGGTGAVNRAIEELLTRAAGTTIPQAIWTEEDQILTLLCASKLYVKGDTLNGKTVTEVWCGEEVDATKTDVMPDWRMVSFEKLVIDSSFSVARPRCLSRWFSGLSEDTLTGLEYLNTSKVRDMSWLFTNSAFKNLDLSTFDTSSVTDMSNMFSFSYELKQVDLSGFDTSKVQSMGRMFCMCSALEELDLSGFNTSRVENMGMMFDFSGLRVLDLSGFDVSRVTTAWRMFDECVSLETIYCKDSDTEWYFAPDCELDGFFWACKELTGVYQDAVVAYSDEQAGAEYAKSAKLGGYFTPKNGD